MIFISCAGTFWYILRLFTNLSDLEQSQYYFVRWQNSMCDGTLSVVDMNYDMHPNNIWLQYLSDLSTENDDAWTRQQERTFEICRQKWR